MAGDDSLHCRTGSRASLKRGTSKAKRPDLVASHVIDMSVTGEDLGVASGRRAARVAQHRGLGQKASLCDWRCACDDAAALRSLRPLESGRFPRGSDQCIPGDMQRRRADDRRTARSLPTGRRFDSAVSCPASFARSRREGDARHLAVFEQCLATRRGRWPAAPPQSRPLLSGNSRGRTSSSACWRRRQLERQLSVVKQARHVDARYRFSRLFYLRAPRLALALKRVAKSW